MHLFRIYQNCLRSVSCLLLGSLLVVAPVQLRAAETIRMIAVDSYSSTALWVKVFIEYFIPEVDRRLAEQGEYEIDWNPAFGGTIAKTKGVLDSLQHDLADIGIITTCLLYTSPSPRDQRGSRMPSSA